MAPGWLWWRAWFPFVAIVPGVALGDIDLPVCGRRGTYGTALALVARLVPVCRRCRRGSLCGRRGIPKHRPPFCVAGVALGNIDLHFEWQAWQLMGLGWLLVPVCCRCRRASLCGRRMQAWHSESSTSILCGGRDIDLHFVWQAWHLWRWAG